MSIHLCVFSLRRANAFGAGERQRVGGTYGAPGSGAQNVDAARFSGTGPLTVRRGNGGTTLTVNEAACHSSRAHMRPATAAPITGDSSTRISS